MIEIIRKAPKGRIMFLHGMGGAVEMYRDFFNTSSINFDFVFPESGYRDCGWINAKDFQCWYDVKKAGDREVRDDVISSANEVKELIQKHEIDFLGGFSQGGALALYTALGLPGVELKGVFSLSGYNMDYEVVNNQTPVFLYHGGSDRTCSYRYAKSTYEVITNARQFYMEVDLDHNFSKGEVLLLDDWLLNLMPPKPKL